MNRSQVYLSTIGLDSASVSKEWGLGLEITQFCTAANIDANFDRTDCEIRQQIVSAQSVIFHAPFNELFPCAIDPKARELAAFRYRQAIDLALGYGASKIVIHGGYNPYIYYPVWYTEQSILFWKDFLQEAPQIQIVLENVLEEESSLLLDIVRAVNHPNFRMCLDIGHVNAYASHSPVQWLEECADWISHFHIHNNDGSWDSHSSLGDGTIPMETLLRQADSVCPEATYTLEVTDALQSVVWMQKHRFI